jgi:hypothetical protein
MYLFYHELAHIAACHLALLREDFGWRVYEEIPLSGISTDEAVTRRALEIEADEQAAQGTFTTWTSLSQAEAFPALSALDPSTSWAISVMMFYLIIDALSPADREVATHPRPEARLMHAMYMVCEENKLYPFAIASHEHVIAGMRVVSRWWKSNGLRMGARRSADETTEELNGYRRELRRISERLTALQLQRVKAEEDQ